MPETCARDSKQVLAGSTHEARLLWKYMNDDSVFGMKRRVIRIVFVEGHFSMARVASPVTDIRC